jgi:hypothetical protein
MRPYWPIALRNTLPQARPRRVTALAQQLLPVPPVRVYHKPAAPALTFSTSLPVNLVLNTSDSLTRPYTTMPDVADIENNAAATTSPPAKRVKTAADDTNGSAAATMDAAPPPLQVKKLSDRARLPTRGSAFAAGYDIYAAKDTTVPARGKVLVDTDISIAVPAGTCK